MPGVLNKISGEFYHDASSFFLCWGAEDNNFMLEY